MNDKIKEYKEKINWDVWFDVKNINHITKNDLCEKLKII